MKLLMDNEKQGVFIQSKERLGTMRLDWCNGEVCNTWHMSNDSDEKINLVKVDLSKVQCELNELIFNQLYDFQKVLCFCEGEGYSKEALFIKDGTACTYYIRLIPVRDTYSYIYVYMN